jgi:hypothetical protein
MRAFDGEARDALQLARERRKAARDLGLDLLVTGGGRAHGKTLEQTFLIIASLERIFTPS